MKKMVIAALSSATLGALFAGAPPAHAEPGIPTAPEYTARFLPKTLLHYDRNQTSCSFKL